MSHQASFDFEHVEAKEIEQIDAACDRLAQEWRAGTAPRIEDFLRDMPDIDQRLLLRELLATELEIAGPKTSQGEYLRRFPDHRELILEMLGTSSPTMAGADDTSVWPAGDENVMPTRLGRYEIHSELGRGAFGVVYRGHDPRLSREVAIKTPVRLQDAKTEQEFLDEARRLARLNHPGIVRVYDVEADNRKCFVVSAFLPGANLASWLKHNQPSWQKATEITRSLAEALAHAHAQRIVHRDLKPGNVILQDDGQPVLVDFGLAVCETGTRYGGLGTVAGTPHYMAPEQAEGKGHRIDGRTDVYGLGAILYKMLTGRAPFQAENIEELLRQVREDEPQPPRQLQPDIPKELERVCLKAMAKRFRHRYTTAGDFAADLARVLSSPNTISESLVTRVESMESQTSDLQAEDSGLSQTVVQDGKTITQDNKASKPASDSGSGRRAREGERRRLTVVRFGCDVFDSEEVLETLDEEDLQETLLEFQQLCRKVVDSAGATFVQMTDDGLLACFGYPIAFEDATTQAVRMGRKLLTRMPKFNRSQNGDVTLRATIAIHNDSAVVKLTNDELSIAGQLLNAVNQIYANAELDSVVVSQGVYRLISNAFECESLGETRLRGLGLVETYAVQDERAYHERVAPSMTPLVGRDREVELLRERWEHVSEGMGQVVSLIGEAGLGKSRLVNALKEHVDEQADGRPQAIIEWRCSSQFENSSFYPAADYLQRTIGIEARHSQTQRLTLLTEHLRELNLDGGLEVSLAASLLSISASSGELGSALANLTPQQQQEKTFELLLDWLREQSYQTPILFIIEDLHWVDPTTLSFLETLVDQAQDDAILTLLTFRPDFVTPWRSMAHQTQIALNRLTKRQIGEMMVLKAGVENIDQRLVDQIAERTDGVPLFVEEFTRMVVESGSLKAGSVAEREIPTTLQDLLAARLDRMDSDFEVAQLGAVIGREFSLELIREASSLSEDALNEELEKLVAGEVLMQRGRPPRTRYIFKHALIQDAAYNSLLRKKRQSFHLRIGEVLEQRFEQSHSGQPELLAHHFTEAGTPDKAIAYWSRAGERSLERNAHLEAIRHFRRGLKLLENSPGSSEFDALELQMLTGLGVPLQSTIGYGAPEVEATYARAYELCRRDAAATQQFPVLYGMFRYYMLRADYAKAQELGEQLVELAGSANNPNFTAAANRAMGGLLVYQGRHARAIPHLEKVMAIEATPRMRTEAYRYDVVDPWIASQSYLSWALWLSGHPDQARQQSEQAVETAKELEHPFSVALALSFAQWLHQFARDVESVQNCVQQTEKICDENNFAFWGGWCRVLKGWTLIQKNESQNAIQEIRQGIKDWRAQGSQLGCHYFYAMLAEAYLGRDDMVKASEALHQARQFADQTGEGYWLAEVSRLRGQVELLRGGEDSPAAETHFREALECARSQQARSLELRAAVSLARSVKASGKVDESCELLETVYRQFESSGIRTSAGRPCEFGPVLETQDLREARTLLDEL